VLSAVRLPRPLATGARIGVVALSGGVDLGRLDAGIAWLRRQGFEVVEAANARERTGYTAGDNAARLAGLEQLLDAGVDALWATRGGYGAMRLLPRIPWERLASWGGWVVGFSDLTVLHAGLQLRAGLASLHGPMVGALTRHEPSARRAVDILVGRAPRRLMRVDAPQVLSGGRAAGPAVGGTLAMLAALAGTPFEPDYEGAVVFLEDVGEPLYRLDRLLTQLRLSSRLAGARAVLAGRLEQCGVGEKGWRGRWRELLVEAAPPGAVVVEGLPFGHGTVNTPFPLGVEVEVDTVRGELALGGA
jgi:muramoyltetrapeptide carboxypeptidase